MTINTNNYTLGMCAIYFNPNVAWAYLRVATSMEATAYNLGNIVSAEITPDVSYIYHYISDKGKRKRDKTALNQVDISIPFQFDEINWTTMKRYFMASKIGTDRLAMFEETLLEGSAKLKFDTDTGNDFTIYIPKCTIKPDGPINMNIEDWWTGPMVLDVLYYETTATPWSTAPYGYMSISESTDGIG